MKKIGVILFAIMLIGATLVMTSCGGGGDAPDGMQLVYGGEACGYYFYAPSEWTVSNVGEIKSEYISRINTTSVSFAEIVPTVSIDGAYEDYLFTKSFEDSLKEFPDGFKVEVKVNGDKAVFGKEGEAADKAIKYTYEYEYASHKFGFMQILMKKADRYYIFTYASQAENNTDDKTYSDYYLAEKVLPVIENFRFVEKKSAEEEKIEYPKDKDGYLLVTDKDLAGFNFYIPDSFKVDYSSGIVSATAPDGSNVSMTEATGTGTTFSKYWEMRKTELEAIVGKVEVIRADEPTTIGNARTGFAYEYTFSYNGEKYHVYQVLCIAGPTLKPEGYVLTYTAKETNYDSHKTEIDNIISKVKFK